MIMLHHIPEEHGVEVRLQDFDFFHLAFFENYLWKTALLAITAEGDRHLCLSSFAKWICLGAFERQIFLETQRILAIFVRPSSQSGSHFF